LLREVAEPVPSIEEADLGPVLERIGDARVVLVGEASHGTPEFYNMCAPGLTQALIQYNGGHTASQTPIRLRSKKSGQPCS
jgi:protein-L-isoaspartate(D-aspartate) O-methyltransferase